MIYLFKRNVKSATLQDRQHYVGKAVCYIRSPVMNSAGSSYLGGVTEVFSCNLNIVLVRTTSKYLWHLSCTTAKQHNGKILHLHVHVFILTYLNAFKT